MQLEELSIEVTNECTLSCIHCSSGSTPRKLKDELTLEEHLSLIGQARVMGATVLSLSGGNPLLCDHVTKLVDYASAVGYDRILMYVTGHHRMGCTIDSWPGVHRLMGYEQTVWIFSLHSNESGVNDYIMNTDGAYDDIVRSIEWLHEHGQDVEVHMVPMAPNYRHITAMRKLCEFLGISKLSLLRFVPQTRGKLNIDKLGMTIPMFTDMQLTLAQEMEKDSPVEIRLGCPIDFRHVVGARHDKAKPCHAGDDLILVRPDGSVHPCAAWKSLETDSNVREHNLMYIFNHSELYTAIRDFKRVGYHKIVGCTSCDYLDSCMAGCPAQRLHAYGQTLQDLYCRWSDPLCPVGSHPG